MADEISPDAAAFALRQGPAPDTMQRMMQGLMGNQPPLMQTAMTSPDLSSLGRNPSRYYDNVHELQKSWQEPFDPIGYKILEELLPRLRKPAPQMEPNSGNIG